MTSALNGIKIADFSRVLAGPYATMLLGDLGADVIKIERTGTGDDTRGWGPPFDAQGRATYFQSVNRNKSGIALNLANPNDAEKALEIALASDVLVENFQSGGMEKFGLGYEQLKVLNPKIIYCSITGFGSSEAAAELPGYDLLVQGMSGLMSITGEPDSPTKVGVALIDVLAGTHATIGILAALRARDTQGIGQKIEINLLSSALSAMVNQTGAFAGAGVTPKAMGNAHPSIVPYEMFNASDKKFILAVGNDTQWQRFAEAITPELAIEKYAKNSDRVAHRKELIAALNTTFATATAEFWITKIRALSIPVGPINSIPEAVALAESIGLDPIVEIESSRTIANPITMSETPISYRKAPPTLDHDN